MTKKRTKKFIAKGLKTELERRKKKQKIARSNEKAKRVKAINRQARAEEEKSLQARKKAAADKISSVKKAVEELNVDEFLDGSFLSGSDEVSTGGSEGEEGSVIYDQEELLSNDSDSDRESETGENSVEGGISSEINLRDEAVNESDPTNKSLLDEVAQ